MTKRRVTPQVRRDVLPGAISRGETHRMSRFPKDAPAGADSSRPGRDDLEPATEGGPGGAIRLARSLFAFLGRAIADFRENQGLLLSGGVAYYMLLSIVPLFILLLVALSHVVDQEALLETVESNLKLVIPGQWPIVAAQIEHALSHWEAIGLVGFLALLFFSAAAFNVLEGAISIIFDHRIASGRRRVLVSVVLPYLFMTMVGGGVVLVTIISAALQAVGRESLRVFGHSWWLTDSSGPVVYWLGVLGLVMLLTALYVVLPAAPVQFRHALIGGVTATVLWELVRRVLVWYFARLSTVNVIYGSLGAVVVLLLTLEVAAVILLFGAQVVAEMERMHLASGPLRSSTQRPRN